MPKWAAITRFFGPTEVFSTKHGAISIFDHQAGSGGLSPSDQLSSATGLVMDKMSVQNHKYIVEAWLNLVLSADSLPDMKERMDTARQQLKANQVIAVHPDVLDLKSNKKRNLTEDEIEEVFGSGGKAADTGKAIFFGPTPQPRGGSSTQFFCNEVTTASTTKLRNPLMAQAPPSQSL